MPEENIKLKQYLLGTLTEPETEEIDLRVISDDSFADELSMAESDMIEDYLEGTLSDEQVQLFRASFMTSREREEQLQEISLLKTYAHSQDVKKNASESTEKLSFTELLRSYFRPITIVAATVAAVLVIGLIWSGYFGSSSSVLEKEYAELNKRDLSNVSELSDYSSVNLSSGSFRDANSAARQNGDQLTETVLFRLAITSNAADGSTFKAKISRSGTLVFTLENARVYQNPNGQELRILLPKSILQKGQYQIRLENASGSEVGNYTFVIE